jgi:hypothetical protein
MYTMLTQMAAEKLPSLPMVHGEDRAGKTYALFFIYFLFKLSSASLSYDEYSIHARRMI